MLNVVECCGNKGPFTPSVSDVTPINCLKIKVHLY